MTAGSRRWWRCASPVRSTRNARPAPGHGCEDGGMHAYVAAVHRSGAYTFTKPTVATIDLLDGLGVAGDVHAGATVRHRSRVARDPTPPNLRQVHLIHGELHEELRAAGFPVGPGAM